MNNNYTDVNVSNHTRDCIADFTAVSILADKIPSFLLKLVLPFIPFYTKYEFHFPKKNYLKIKLFLLILWFQLILVNSSRTNIVLACVFAIASYIIVALAQHKWQAILGITLMSINGDLSDITILTYLAKFEDR